MRPKTMKYSRLSSLYVLTHPKHPGLVKVGRAINYVQRLGSYNAGCPDRAYRMPVVAATVHAAHAEQHAHGMLSEHHHSHEWFQCSVEVAEAAVMASVVLYQPDAIQPFVPFQPAYLPATHD